MLQACVWVVQAFNLLHRRVALDANIEVQHRSSSTSRVCCWEHVAAGGAKRLDGLDIAELHTTGFASCQRGELHAELRVSSGRCQCRTFPPFLGLVERGFRFGLLLGFGLDAIPFTEVGKARDRGVAGQWKPVGEVCGRLRIVADHVRDDCFDGAASHRGVNVRVHESRPCVRRGGLCA